MIPTHTADGFLPEGIHSAAWEEVVDRFGFSPRRAVLLAGLREALTHLHDAGASVCYWPEASSRRSGTPKDTDVCWNVDGVDPDLVHPMFLSPAGIPVTLATFGGEFFPHFLVEGDTGLPFAEFLQRARDGRAVGVVEIDLNTLP